MLRPSMRPQYAVRAHLRISSRSPLETAWVRLNSTTIKPKPARVLEKPDKFRPPSHPARIRQPNAYTTPPLPEKERQAQNTRQYPHMMPPEGSFLHSFLSSRWIHLTITMSVLVGLTGAVFVTNFLTTTPYRDLLPPNNMFMSHPIDFLSRWVQVYFMHTEWVTEQTMAKREAKAEDVKKRAEYRRAHGLETGRGLAGWTAKTDDDGSVTGGNVGADTQSPVAALDSGSAGEYTDFDGQRRRVKKWFGIW